MSPTGSFAAGSYSIAKSAELDDEGFVGTTVDLIVAARGLTDSSMAVCVDTIVALVTSKRELHELEDELVAIEINGEPVLMTIARAEIMIGRHGWPWVHGSLEHDKTFFLNAADLQVVVDVFPLGHQFGLDGDGFDERENRHLQRKPDAWVYLSSTNFVPRNDLEKDIDLLLMCQHESNKAANRAYMVDDLPRLAAMAGEGVVRISVCTSAYYDDRRGACTHSIRTEPPLLGNPWYTADEFLGCGFRRFAVNSPRTAEQEERQRTRCRLVNLT